MMVGNGPTPSNNFLFALEYRSGLVRAGVDFYA